MVFFSPVKKKRKNHGKHKQTIDKRNEIQGHLVARRKEKKKREYQYKAHMYIQQTRV